MLSFLMRLDQNTSSNAGGSLGFSSWHSPTTTAQVSSDPRRAWPDSVAFREAIQSPGGVLADPDLRQSQVSLDRLGMPLSYSGRFAIVFRLTNERGERWALRCFTSPGEDGRGATRATRYRIITEHTTRMDNTFVPFRYIERGIRIGTVWYPIVAMRWAAGEPLGRWVESHLHDPAALRRLCGSLSGLLERLENAGMAHGDWQHDNLLISEDGGRVTVVDYDGMFVPEFAGMPSPELGHPNYQHPDRTSAHYGVGLDRFACLTIETALLALAHDPSLWARFADGESLLFKKPDFEDPEISPVFQSVRAVAERANDDELRESINRLEDACEAGAITTLLPAIAAAPAPSSIFAEEDAQLAAVAAREAVRRERQKQDEMLWASQPGGIEGAKGKWWQVPETAAALAGSRRRNRAGATVVAKQVRPGDEYLARLSSPETVREERWHLWRWRAGGLAFNAFVLTMLYQLYVHSGYHPLMFLWVLNFAGLGYGHWPRKRIYEALNAEIGKMEHLIADRERRIAAKGGQKVPSTEGEFIAQRLREVSIADIVRVHEIRPSTIRALRAAGVDDMLEFRERLAVATGQGLAPTEQIVALQKWCGELEREAAADYRKVSASLRTVPVEVDRLRHELAEFQRHAAILKRERDQFPDASFAAYLRRLTHIDGGASTAAPGGPVPVTASGSSLPKP